MKKLIFLLLLFSCEKGGQDCYDCLIKTETYHLNLLRNIEYENTYQCGDIYYIRQYEEKNTHTTYKDVDLGIMGKFKFRIETTCTCESID